MNTVHGFTPQVFQWLITQQPIRRRDGLVAFSSNWRSESWCFAGYGPTPWGNRKFVHGKNAFLDDLFAEYSRLREECGRLFICACLGKGSFMGFAFCKPHDELGGLLPIARLLP